MRRRTLALASIVALLSLTLLALAAPTTRGLLAQEDLPDDAEGEEAQSDATPFIWIEGEDPEETNFPATSDFSINTLNAVAYNKLSSSDWLSSSGTRGGDALYAAYEIAVETSGDYHLWCRKFWKHGPFRWRIGRGDWHEVGRDIGLEDSTPLRRFVAANWVYLDQVELSRDTTLRIELTADEGQNQTSAFDCFCFIQGDFAPRGRFKPGERSGAVQGMAWAFEPGIDTFEETPIDLRWMNEKRAGDRGFLKRKGDKIVAGPEGARRRPDAPMLERRDEVKLWGVNCGGGVLELSKPSLRYLARRLAKLGVNLVRVHTPFFDASSDDPADINETQLDRLHFFQAELAEQGIYTKLSFYFPLWFDIRNSYDIDGYESIQNKRPFSLLFFNERMQEIHRAWMETLLTEDNPYTGISLAEDPALAMVEIQNEDSFLFWTFSAQNIPEAQLETLEERYAEWLDDRYGSERKALAEWGWDEQARDQPRRGRMHLLDAWHMTHDGATQSPAKRKRMSDQLRFLVELQREFYQQTIDWARDDLDLKCMISCSNWHTSDAKTLQPLEFFSYTPGDIIDSHGYFSAPHEGDGASYSIAVEQRFESRSSLDAPWRSPAFVVSVADYPRMISEIGWPNPNRFRAEWPFLCATYGALNGVDAFCHFAIGTAHWEGAPEKFSLADPVLLGQFPALALAYRRGDISEADPVLVETLDEDALYNFEGSQAVATQNLDAFRDTGERAGDDSDDEQADSLAFMVGPVVQDFGRADIEREKIEEHIEREAKRVSDPDQQLTWDGEQRVVTLSTERAEGLCGFVHGYPDLTTGALSVTQGRDNLSVMAISLDRDEARSLRESKQILLQVATESWHYGWSADDEGRIEALGSYPFNVAFSKAFIKLEVTRTNFTLVALDANGAVKRELEEGEDWGYDDRDRKARPRIWIDFPSDALYVLITE